MKRLYIFLFLLSSLSLVAQQDFTLINMQEIPQSSYSNPSNRFNGSFYIGLPAISSNYFSFTNSRFAYSDAVIKSGNSLNFDLDQVIEEAGENNYLSFNTKTDLFSFGISLNEKTQLMVNVTENANLRLNYTNDFMRFVYRGNASFEDNTANLEGIGINAIHYREYAVGVSHQLNEQLRLGIKAKYLYGMENIYSERTDIRLITDPETFEITAQSDISLRTAGIIDVEGDENFGDYILGRKNRGFAVDLGANYQLNEKLSLTASILDLGAIKWNDHTKNYSNNGEFVYNGIEINAFSDEDPAADDRSTSFNRVVDSMEKALNLDSNTNSYTAPLTSRFFIGANYQLNEKSIVGGLIQSEIFQRKIYPSFTANYHRKMNKWIGLSASYTVFNGSYTNLGLGLNVNPGPVQFYIVSDNVIHAFQPQHAQYLQLRFGINLIFGSQKSKEINPYYTKKSNKDSGDSED